MIKNCVFCRIVRGELPSDRVYEDEDVLCFLDIAPLAPGHALVIPKEHHTSLTTVPKALRGRLMAAVPDIANALTRATDSDGFNLLLSNGACAGQVVPHVHLHIVPRRADDAIVLPVKTVPYESDEARKTLLEAVRNRLQT